MKPQSISIFQEQFSIEFADFFKYYLILVEIVNGVPKRSYIVPMEGFKFWDTESYYTINQN
jgi:hypothetical protein